jgi:hypothetical protein
MEESKDLNATIIKSTAYFFFMLLCISTGSLLTILLVFITYNKFYAFIGMFISIFFPGFIFKKQLRKPFINRVDIKCSSETISVEIYNRKTQELEKTDVIELNQVKCFKLWASVKDDACSFKVNFKNGDKISYMFLNDTKNVKKVKVEDVLSKYLKDYNNSQNEDSYISMSPNLFASRLGSFYITMLTLLFVGALIFEAMYKPKAIIFTLLGSGFLYFIIIAQRKQELQDLENFNKK